MVNKNELMQSLNRTVTGYLEWKVECVYIYFMRVREACEKESDKYFNHAVRQKLTEFSLQVRKKYLQLSDKAEGS